MYKSPTSTTHQKKNHNGACLVYSEKKAVLTLESPGNRVINGCFPTSNPVWVFEGHMGSWLSSEARLGEPAVSLAVELTYP